ncbi:hypothetical protein AYI68_g4169 [Smittium mucronatum]|uniref:Uncharacterized protein n=1 Tax=Smittium mucronatum TaxID=133383 RepID=A0A1R0GXV0_9FUNG|nr:hypothetical protein AYI68_g4169 [Smittium mucronatum]
MKIEEFYVLSLGKIMPGLLFTDDAAVQARKFSKNINASDTYLTKIGEATLSALFLASSSPSPNIEIGAGITSLLRLSTPRPFLPALTTLRFFTAPTVEIISGNLNLGLGTKLSGSSSKEDTRSYISSSLAKLKNWSNSSSSAGNSDDIDN